MNKSEEKNFGPFIYQINYRTNTAVILDINFKKARDKAGVKLVIPGEIKGFPVVAVNEQINYKRSNTEAKRAIEEIVLSENIEAIGGSAFHSMEAVTHISLPSSLRRIGAHAFQGLKSCARIVLPDNLQIIEPYAFRENGLEDIILPPFLKRLGYSAFHSCKNLRSVEFPPSFNEIEAFAFGYCDSLETVVFPRDLKVIRARAFANSNIKSAVFPQTLRCIGACAFKHEFLSYGNAAPSNANIPMTVSINPACWYEDDSFDQGTIINNKAHEPDTSINGLLVNNEDVSVIRSSDPDASSDYIISQSVKVIDGTPTVENVSRIICKTGECTFMRGCFRFFSSYTKQMPCKFYHASKTEDVIIIDNDMFAEDKTYSVCLPSGETVECWRLVTAIKDSSFVFYPRSFLWKGVRKSDSQCIYDSDYAAVVEAVVG